MAREVLAGAVLDVHQRSGKRIDEQRRLEQAIVAHKPDTIDAVELLHSLSRALRDRYGDPAVDVLERLNEACEALQELERMLGGDSSEDIAWAEERARVA